MCTRFNDDVRAVAARPVNDKQAAANAFLAPCTAKPPTVRGKPVPKIELKETKRAMASGGHCELDVETIHCHPLLSTIFASRINFHPF